MQCLRVWFTIWLCAISVNHSVASPVDTLNVDNKTVGDLNTAESKHDEAEVAERDNEVGYLRRADEKGADAYQHFESFHDKDGDAYGYEKHEAYGKSNKGESLNDEKDKDEGSHYTYAQELGDKAKYQKYQGHNDDPGKGTNSNYHYSYNSDDDEEDEDKKPYYSSNYSEESKKDDSSDDDDDDNEEGDDGTDEEKTTHFNYKIISDDYAEGDHGDVNSKGNGKGYGYHYGHGDKNTDVDYNVKRSDYTADDSNEDDNDDEDEHGGNSEEDEDNDVKNEKIKDDQGQGKNTKSYSTYTSYNSDEGDKDDDESDDDHEEEGHKNKPSQKHVTRYEHSYPKKVNKKHSNKIKANHDRDETDGTNDGHINKDVELHQSAKPEPAREHRTQYSVKNVHPKSTPQAYVQPSKPTTIVQKHPVSYKVEEATGDKASDGAAKGHAGSIFTHSYEIYVTHDTSNSNGGSDGGAKGGDGNGKSENLVIEKSQELNEKANSDDNGAYKVNINYGDKKGVKKNGKKGYRKRKGNLKKQKIVKPHKYEVEEYDNSGERTKKSAVIVKTTSSPQHTEPVVAGKASSPQHHRDSDDYSNGQQFLYASEADSDAYYW